MAAEYDSKSLVISKSFSCFFSCDALRKIYHNKGLLALYFWKKTMIFRKKFRQSLTKILCSDVPAHILTFPACTTNVFINQALRQSYSKPITKHWCSSWVKKLFKFSKLENNSTKKCRHRMVHSFFMLNNFLFWKIIFCW